MNIVLMAGGGGTRLWPLSRQDNPKQFLDLGTGTTLLEQTFRRAKALTKTDNIYVATMGQYEARVRELLPEVPSENIFVEPERRDNAAAFAAVALQLSMRDHGETPTTFFWCDHVFTSEEEFVNDIRKIPQILKQYPDYIVIAGHTPTHAETSLGYIETDKPVAGYDDVFVVKSFKEKPDLATAEKYVLAGNYFWNMGAVSARPTYLLSELLTYQPEFQTGLAALRAAFEANDATAVTAAYQQFPKISIDYAVMEHTPRIIVVTGDYGWSDVGTWTAVKEIFGATGDHMPLGHHVQVDSENNYIYNATGRAVSLIGVSDTIVVVTDDAILVTDTSSAAKVKDVVAKLEADEQTDYL